MDKLYEKGLNYALYLLSLKMYTTAQIHEKMVGKAYEDDIIKKVVSYLTDSGFLNDQTYAEYYIRSNQQKYGTYRMKQMLYRKGIDDKTINRAYEALEDSEELVSAEETVEQILDKKIANTKIDWERLKTDYKYKMSIYQKLASFLANRGFSSGVIKTAVSERLAEQFFDEF